MNQPLQPLSPLETRQLQAWCAAVRLTIQPHTETIQGQRAYTYEQQKLLQAAFAPLVRDRDERLAMLTYILITSGLTGLPFTSFNQLSEAQAAGLITALYGPPTEGSPRITGYAESWLIQVRTQVRWQSAAGWEPIIE